MLRGPTLASVFLLLGASILYQYVHANEDTASIAQTQIWTWSEEQIDLEGSNVLQWLSENAGRAESNSDQAQGDAEERGDASLSESEDDPETAESAALERLLIECQQRLALNGTMRNVPFALEGYERLVSQLTAMLKEDQLQNATEAGNLALQPEVKRIEEENATASEKYTVAGTNNSSSIFNETASRQVHQRPQFQPLARAAYDLAMLSLTGLASSLYPRNESYGLDLLHSSGQAGNVQARIALAYRYLQGRGVSQDCDKAFRYGKEVAASIADHAEKGFIKPPAEQLLLKDRWMNSDFLMPLPKLVSEAESSHLEFTMGWENNPLDGFDLYGMMHGDEGLNLGADAMNPWSWLLGLPLPSSKETVFEVLRRLAEEGDAEALFNLGYLCLQGQEVPQNVTAAFILFRMAAVRGSPNAYNALGVMAYNGGEIPQDYDAARHMFEIGAAAGDMDGLFNLGALYLSGHGVDKDQEKAFKYLKEANRAGHWQAPLQLAHMYHKGEAIPKDCKKAFRHLTTFLNEQSSWLEDVYSAVNALDSGDEWKGLVLLALAAEQGSPTAQHNLGFTLQRTKSFDMPGRLALAYDMFLRSGEYFSSGLTDAGLLVWNGLKHQLSEGTNRTKAMELFSEASGRGDTEATFYLGRAHHIGSNIPVNITRAAEFYRLAISKAPSFRSAAPPRLALVLLQLGGVGQMARLLARAVHTFLQWDVAVLSVLITGLVSILWLKWQRQRLRQRQHSHES